MSGPLDLVGNDFQLSLELQASLRSLDRKKLVDVKDGARFPLSGGSWLKSTTLVCRT
jgi:hypothetical protein